MPSEFGFGQRSPKYGPFLVLGLFDTNGAHSGLFLAIFGLFLGHIVELEGEKELFVIRQSRRTCSVLIVALRLAVLSGFRGCFRAKKACFGAQNEHFWERLPTWRPHPGAPLVSFWLKFWIRQSSILDIPYPLIYTPLPNSSWLHNTALRYVPRVQLGALHVEEGAKLGQNRA